MDTRQKLDAALKDAMRTNNTMQRATVRMVLSAVKLAEVEKGSALDEAAVLTILQKEMKSRQEALQEARKANRADLAEQAQAESAFLQTFLPQQLSAEELAVLVYAAIEETAATHPADMGKVMKALMPRVQGRLPGDQVSAAVRQALQK